MSTQPKALPWERANHIIIDEQTSARVPRWRLVALLSIQPLPFQAKNIAYPPPEAMQFIDEDGQSQYGPGVFRPHIGSSSPWKNAEAFVEIMMKVEE